MLSPQNKQSERSHHSSSSPFNTSQHTGAHTLLIHEKRGQRNEQIAAEHAAERKNNNPHFLRHQTTESDRSRKKRHEVIHHLSPSVVMMTEDHTRDPQSEHSQTKTISASIKSIHRSYKIYIQYYFMETLVPSFLLSLSSIPSHSIITPSSHC